MACWLSQDKPSVDEVLRLVRSGGAGAEAAIVASMGEDNLKTGKAVLYRGGEFVFALRSQREPLLVINDETPRRMNRNFHNMVASEPFGSRTDVPAFGPYPTSVRECRRARCRK